jgi:signal transduction histidine kinase
VERVAQGSLDTEVPLGGARELIDLGRSFNRMTATLREQQDELKVRLVQLERSSQELKAVQDKLIRAAKLASVGTLAAGVAHEIGNPLAGLLGLIDALEGEQDQEQVRHYKELMRRDIERIDRTIADLLHFARLPRSGDTEPASADLISVLKHVRSLLGAQKLFDRVEFETTLSQKPWRVAIVQDDLTQLLVNLLLNAAQAMKGQGVIQVGAEKVCNWRPQLGVVMRDAVQITVTDNGPGVPQENQKQIFDPFFTTSTRGAGQGTGLGLAICQSIVERAGGEILLDPDYSEGARFVLVLPAG